MKKNRIWAWIKWFLFSEGLITLLAMAGPGTRYSSHRRNSHALIARLFFEEPTYWQAVVVNFVTVNLFIICAWSAAWTITKLRK
jgi:hypothetical protein